MEVSVRAPRQKGELAKLSPAQRDYVVDNFGDLLQHGIDLYVSTPSGNGNQPVLTLKPHDLTRHPGQRYNVQTHYHGDIWPNQPAFQDKNTIVDAMQRLWKKDSKTVFVLPQTQVFGEARGTAPVGGQQGHTAWNNVVDEKQTTDAALTEAGLDPAQVGERTVSGHSSGGYPLSRVMASTAHDPAHPTIAADRILILDTVRGSLADGTVPTWWQVHHPQTVDYVDATMHAFTRAQAEAYGWTFLTAHDHFDAVRSFLDYGRHVSDRDCRSAVRQLGRGTVTGEPGQP